MEELDFDRVRFDAAFAQVIQTLTWQWDKDHRVLFIPSWWKYNQPENANVLKGNLKDLDEIPLGSPLIRLFAENLVNLDQTFHQTFQECMSERLSKRSIEGLGKHSVEGQADIRQISSSNSSKEQKQEQEQTAKTERKREERSGKGFGGTQFSEQSPSPVGRSERDDSLRNHPMFREFRKRWARKMLARYEVFKTDYIQFESLLERLAVLPNAIPAGLDQAVTNFLSSPLKSFRFHFFCLNFDSFRNGVMDPEGPEGHLLQGKQSHGNPNGKTKEFDLSSARKQVTAETQAGRGS